MSKEAAVAQLSTLVGVSQPSVALAPAPTNTPTIAQEPVSIPAPAQTDSSSSRINQLLKKESELQRQRELTKQERATLASEKAQWSDLQKTLSEFKEMKSKDPVAALKLAGFSEADLIAFANSAADNSTPEQKAARAAQAEIQKFKDEQADTAKKATDTRNGQVLQQFRQDIAKTINTNAEKYEYCNYNGPLAAELIYDTVAAVLADSGEVISIAEAADLVETYYEDTDKAMASLKKRNPSKLVAPITEPTLAVEPPRRGSTANTLSSKTIATSAPLASAVPKKETSTEKRERLIRKLAGN